MVLFDVLEDLDVDEVRVDEDDLDLPSTALRCGAAADVRLEQTLTLLAFEDSTVPPCWLVILPSALRLVVMPCFFAAAAAEASLFELPN